MFPAWKNPLTPLEEKFKRQAENDEDRKSKVLSPCCKAEPYWELTGFAQSATLGPGKVGFSYFGNPRCLKCERLLKTRFK